jgi:hypothetical protein
MASSTDIALQRILNVVEKHSETIENQAKRIQWLEDQHSHYLKTISDLETKLNALSLSKPFQAHEELEDDEGKYVEV